MWALKLDQLEEEGMGRKIREIPYKYNRRQTEQEEKSRGDQKKLISPSRDRTKPESITRSQVGPDLMILNAYGQQKTKTS